MQNMNGRHEKRRGWGGGGDKIKFNHLSNKNQKGKEVRELGKVGVGVGVR